MAPVAGYSTRQCLTCHRYRPVVDQSSKQVGRVAYLSCLSSLEGQNFLFSFEIMRPKNKMNFGSD